MNNPKDMLVSKTPAHMCRMDHEEIWYNGSKHELCPLCRLRSERDELVGALELIASAKDRGFDIDYARGLAESVVAKHKPE